MRWWKSLSDKVFPQRVAALAIALIAGFLLPLPASAAPLKRISVEVPAGSGPVGAYIRHALPGHLARELAEAGKDGFPPGARLVIRVTEIFLSHDIGGRGRFGVPGMPDGIDGEALILDRRGKIILKKRVVGRSPVSAGGFAFSPHHEPRRVEALTANFAYWIVRELD